MTTRLANLIATGLAQPRDLEAAGVDAVRSAKLDCDVPHLRTRVASAESVDEESRTIRYVWSDETVDRYGDIIRAKGWETGMFDGNPIALYMHDMEQPIGNGIGYGVKGTQLVGGIKFADEGTSEFHDRTWKLAKQGVLKAVSVGFDPLDRVWHDDEEQRKALGLGPMGVEYLRQELLEISLVSIPANPSALQLMLDAGDLTEKDVDAVLRSQVTERDWEKRARAIRRRSVVVDTTLADRVTELENKVRSLSALEERMRAADGARARADADAADAQAAHAALARACDERAVLRALQTLTNKRP